MEIKEIEEYLKNWSSIENLSKEIDELKRNLEVGLNRLFMESREQGLDYYRIKGFNDAKEKNESKILSLNKSLEEAKKDNEELHSKILSFLPVNCKMVINAYDAESNQKKYSLVKEEEDEGVFKINVHEIE